MQAVAEAQDTVRRALSVEPEGLGVVWMDHELPFDDSARVYWLPELSTYSPTAVQELVEVQATLLRRVSSEPEGLGVVSIDHDVPLRFSTKVVVLPELSSEPPTAMHLVEEVHDTPSRVLACAPEGLGVVSMDQEVPFHSSARLNWTSELSR